MTNVIARIRKESKHFEIMVNMEEALKFRKGFGGSVILETDKIFTSIKRGEIASGEELEKAFGTTNIQEIAEKIVKKGEIEETQEHRDAEQEAKVKQVVDFLSKNAVDPKTGNPHTIERIKNAISQAKINIKNKPIENQINEIITELSKILPIKIETKKIKITIPAIYTGKAYGIISEYKDSENWLSNGGLEVIVKIPAGLIMGFYDKLNSVTHGSAITEEIKQD